MKILIATDGSEFSLAAIKKCCEILVNPEKAEIKILSVFENLYPVATEPFAISAEYIQEMEAAGKTQAARYAADAENQLQRCLHGASVAVSTKILKGSAEQAIIEEAEEWGADLIVIGSHGRGFWKRMFLGSVSQTVIQHAPCSVLVVRKPHH